MNISVIPSKVEIRRLPDRKDDYLNYDLTAHFSITDPNGSQLVLSVQVNKVKNVDAGIEKAHSQLRAWAQAVAQADHSLYETIARH